MSSTTKQENNNNTYRPFNRPHEKCCAKHSHHVEQYGGDYWRQAVFYYILLQHAHHPHRHTRTVGSVQFQYVEQKNGEPQESHFVTVTNEDVIAVVNK